MNISDHETNFLTRKKKKEKIIITFIDARSYVQYNKDEFQKVYFNMTGPISRLKTLWIRSGISFLTHVTRRGERVLRAGFGDKYLSNDIKYVRIGHILTKLQSSKYTTVVTHINREMANYLLFIDILGNID